MGSVSMDMLDFACRMCRTLGIAFVELWVHSEWNSKWRPPFSGAVIVILVASNREKGVLS